MKQNKLFGIDTEKAYRDYLERAKERKPEEPKKTERPAPNNIQNADSYLILPGRKHGTYEYPDLLVSTQRTHNQENWNQAHESLRNEGSFMLTLRQYVDFLSLLKSGVAYNGKGKKVDKFVLDGILEDIIAVRTPWRAEWLNAKFSSSGKLKKSWHIAYRDPQGNEIITPLEECLMDDKTPGIDLNYWLSNATFQGPPPKTNPDGSLYYWHPRNEAVAGFNAVSGGAGLDCGGYPRGSIPALGVRAAKIKV